MITQTVTTNTGISAEIYDLEQVLSRDIIPGSYTEQYIICFQDMAVGIFDKSITMLPNLIFIPMNRSTDNECIYIDSLSYEDIFMKNGGVIIPIVSRNRMYEVVLDVELALGEVIKAKFTKRKIRKNLKGRNLTQLAKIMSIVGFKLYPDIIPGKYNPDELNKLINEFATYMRQNGYFLRFLNATKLQEDLKNFKKSVTFSYKDRVKFMVP